MLINAEVRDDLGLAVLRRSARRQIHTEPITGRSPVSRSHATWVAASASRQVEMSKCAPKASSPTSRNFKSLKHRLQLNILQMNLLSELHPQRFDFFVECCQFMKKQLT